MEGAGSGELHLRVSNLDIRLGESSPEGWKYSATTTV
jgi:hypothetical protein